VGKSGSRVRRATCTPSTYIRSLHSVAIQKSLILVTSSFLESPIETVTFPNETIARKLYNRIDVVQMQHLRFSRNPLVAFFPRDVYFGLHLSSSLLKKGTGSELTDENAAEDSGGEVPVPFFNRLLGGGYTLRPAVCI
jgi:hypothetical protein